MTFDRDLNCLAASAVGAKALHAVRPAGLTEFLTTLAPEHARFLAASGFTAAAQELRLLPGGDGLDAAVLGLGEDRSPYAFGDLALRLPERTEWRLAPGDYDPHDAVLGFCLGAYVYPAFKAPKRGPARLVAPDGRLRALSEARAAWMVRDLINTPANVLGPRELAEAALTLAARYKAEARLIEGNELAEAYPTVAAVGRGAARPPPGVGLTGAGRRPEDASARLPSWRR